MMSARSPSAFGRMKKSVILGVAILTRTLAILANLEPISTQMNLLGTPPFRIISVLTFFTFVKNLFKDYAWRVSTIALRLGCPPEQIMAALI